MVAGGLAAVAVVGGGVWEYWFGLLIASTVAVTGNTGTVAVGHGTVYALTAAS